MGIVSICDDFHNHEAHFFVYQLHLHDIKTLHKWDTFHGEEEDLNLYSICESFFKTGNKLTMKAGYSLSFIDLKIYVCVL